MPRPPSPFVDLSVASSPVPRPPMSPPPSGRPRPPPPGGPRPLNSKSSIPDLLSRVQSPSRPPRSEVAKVATPPRSPSPTDLGPPASDLQGQALSRGLHSPNADATRVIFPRSPSPSDVDSPTSDGHVQSLLSLTSGPAPHVASPIPIDTPPIDTTYHLSLSMPGAHVDIERPPLTPSSPDVPPTHRSSPASNDVPDTASITDAQVDTSQLLDTPSSSKPSSRAPSPAKECKEIKNSVGKIAITSPPPINFDSVPVAWKGLTSEAAQWSFSSGELQQIVSRAIRRTADESSIRLLSQDILDRELKDEMARLDTLKAVTQSKYRFLMHRRTMLLQSLCVSDPASANSATSVRSLIKSLAMVTESCDRVVEELLRTADQQAQITKLLDVHATSALAMALRKLNASYAKRTQEVQGLKERIASAEAERDEAWRMAEQIAEEFDGDETDEDADADGMDAGDETGSVFDGAVEVVNATRAVASTATWGRASAIAAKTTGVGPRPPAPPGRRSRSNSAASRVSAARTRSARASKASLRIPKGSRRTKGQQTSPLDALPKHPPLPTGSSFLDMSTRPGSSLPPAAGDDGDDGQIIIVRPPGPGTRPHPFSASFAESRAMSMSIMQALPIAVESNDDTDAPLRAVQSMLPPLRIAPVVDESTRPSSEATVRSKIKRPNSMPISVSPSTSTASLHQKPWGYF